VKHRLRRLQKLLVRLAHRRCLACYSADGSVGWVVHVPALRDERCPYDCDGRWRRLNR
jgi:hypothetical protein